MMKSDLIASEIVLTVLSGEEKGRIILLTAPLPQVVGRGEDADVKLCPDDRCMSRRHVRIEHFADEWRISAVGDSSNPPLVNKNPIDHCPLADGDIIQLGRTRLKVSLGGRAPGSLRCFHCGKDVTALANTDGRALELAPAIVYACPKHIDSSSVSQSIGKYEVCSVLGQGGAGVVYKVYDRATARVLALKRIIDLQSIDKVRRFDREMAEMKSIRHTNIIRFVESGVDEEGVPYLVTEFAPDGSLADFAAGKSYRVPPSIAVELFTAVLDGMKFLHALDDIHRDIKPHNILLRRLGSATQYVPKIADLGLLKKLHGIRITRPNDASGTLGFMPPEQVVNFSGLDVRADIYALGASLYFILTGSFPVDLAGDEAEQLRCVLHADRIPVRRRGAELPARLSVIIDKACRKEPERRFQTADEFQNALAEVRL